MIVEIVLLMQAVASLPPPDTAGSPTFDIRSAIAPDPCGTSSGDEIVVCGRKIDPEHFRLRPLGKILETSPMPKAETTIFGGAKLGVEGETVTVGGAPSNRAMVKLKVPF